MNFSNSIELEIRGERALFRDPVKHEPIPVPSFETLKGILCSVYWNPVFTWVPDRLRVMEKIIFLDEGARLSTGKRTENVTLRYLFNVKYQLRAHFVWNEQRPDLAHDRDENKHFRIALRSLSRGGRRNVYLGSADCPGEVRSVHFGSGEGFYDCAGRVDFGEMFHSFDHAAGVPLYSGCVMESGFIDLPPQGSPGKGEQTCRRN